MSSPDLAEWYYSDGSATFGPFHEAVLRQLRGAGVIRAEFMLWKQGLEGWIPAASIDLSVPPSLPEVPGSRTMLGGAKPGQPLHARAMHPLTQDQGVSKSESPLAVAGMVIAFLVLMAGGIWFWSGRPELLAIVVVIALIKHFVSEARR